MKSRLLQQTNNPHFMRPSPKWGINPLLSVHVRAKSPKKGNMRPPRHLLIVPFMTTTVERNGAPQSLFPDGFKPRWPQANFPALRNTSNFNL
jgi:hypothetical protein